jgi:hypothetical protein
MNNTREQRKRVWHYGLLIFLIIVFSPYAIAREHHIIQQYLKPNTITIIGEYHGRIESMILIKDLVSDVTRQRGCLTLALEIYSDQQPVLDKVMAGTAPVSSITIPYAVDHHHYRNLLKHLARIKKISTCFTVLAIDSGPGNPTARDEWMTQLLSEQVGKTPILVLVGSLHTLKKVDWTVPTGKPFIAELLTDKGLSVNSFPQNWIPEECEAGNQRSFRFMGNDDPGALTILNDSLMSLMNAKRHTSAIYVVDGFILWECSNASHSAKLR